MTVKERVYQLVEVGFKTVTGILPGPFSAAINAVYDGIKSNVLSKRAEKWSEDVIKRLEKLEEDYENLINSDAFATSFIKATELAIKTESDEKRQLLANALVNSYSNSMDEDKALIMFNLVEKYTTLHVRIIKYLHDEYMQENLTRYTTTRFMPILRYKFNNVDSVYLEKAVNDLKNDYLVEKFQDDISVQFGAHRFKMLTKLGEDFYDFLRPLEEE